MSAFYTSQGNLPQQSCFLSFLGFVVRQKIFCGCFLFDPAHEKGIRKFQGGRGLRRFPSDVGKFWLGESHRRLHNVRKLHKTILGVEFPENRRLMEPQPGKWSDLSGYRRTVKFVTHGDIFQVVTVSMMPNTATRTIIVEKLVLSLYFK